MATDILESQTVIEKEGNYSKVAHVLRSCDGDLQVSAVEVRAMLAEDDELRDYVIDAGITVLLQRVQKSVRARIWENEHKLSSSVGDYVETDRTPSNVVVPQMNAGIELVVMSVFDYPLPGGKKLGEATKADLLNSSQISIKQGKTLIERGRWMGMLADRVPFGKTVAESLNESDVQRLMDEAKAAA